MNRIHSPKTLVLVFIAATLIILASSNWLTGVRLDLSENGLYTLSEGTEEILGKLDQPVSLTLYFSDKASTQLPALRTYAQRVEELLLEYESLSNGKITFEKIDPVPFSEEEDAAALAGLQGIPAGPRSDDVYFGLVAKNDAGAEEVIPFMQPDKEAYLEYELTRLISSLAKTSVPKVGVISGIEIQGGYDYMTRQQRPAWAIMEFIEEGFEIEWIEDDATSIEGVEVLLLLAPQNLSDSLLFAIDQYVLAGGRTLVFLDPYSEVAAQQGGMPSIQRSDLAELLPNWGLELRKDVIATDFENSMVVSLGQGRNPVRHIGLFSTGPDSFVQEDIILFGLEDLNWSSAGILDTVEGASTTVEPLIATSDQSMPKPAEMLLQLHDPEALLSDFAPSGERYTLAARVSGKAKTAFADGIELVKESPSSEEKESNASASDEEKTTVQTEQLKPRLLEGDNIQVMVFSDSDILSDRLWVQVQNFFGQQIVTPWSDNGSLLINSLETMSGAPELIKIRSQGRFTRPFEVVNDLRRDAEERLLAQQELLEEELGATEQKLIELEQLRNEGDGALFTAEQETELLKFQEEKLKIRKQLRDVQHQLDQDIEALGTQLKLINIFLVPGLICLFVLLGTARKRVAA